MSRIGLRMVALVIFAMALALFSGCHTDHQSGGQSPDHSTHNHSM